MARGRLLKTKIREAEHLAAATVRGREHAQQKAEKDKDYLVSLREHIGKMIDRVDPLEVAAIGACTVLIEPAVEAGIKSLAIDVNSVLGLLNAWAGWIPYLGPLTEASKYISESVPAILEKNRLTLYIASFVFAFLLIRHGAELASAGFKGVTGLLSMLNIGAVMGV